ncbi:DUF3180 family protein, partial [Cellulomonas septica]|nr:DUF3180 family protein [Cellulomonas septica]
IPAVLLTGKFGYKKILATGVSVVAVAAVATGGAVVLAVVGLVVERFCRVPPPDEGAVRREEATPDPSA